MKKQPNGLLKSFGFAFKGIGTLIRRERNAKLHGLATLVVITGGIILGLGANEWCIVLIAIGCVFAAEGFNTAIERLADVVSPTKDPRIAIVKDIAAGSVLITAIMALAIAIFIFGPKIFA